MSGKKSKVIQFPTATRNRIVCQYSSGTTIEPSHNHKVSKIVDNEFKLFGAVIGATFMFGIMYLSALTIYGA